MMLRLCIAFLVTNLACVRGQDYDKTPGKVSALKGSSANISFQPSRPDDEIFWCYWKYSTCESHQGCPTEPFIGYNKLDGRRENISRRHQGWLFENTDRPCQGGIWRSKTEDRHRGWYQMIYDDHDRKEYDSDFFPLSVYEENDLVVRISINGDALLLPLSNGKHEPIKMNIIKGISDSAYVMNISAAPGMPRDVRYKVSKSVHGGGRIVMNECSRSDTGACEAEIRLGQENGVIVTAAVDTRIQGYPDIDIVQPFDYTGISTTARDAAIGCAGILAVMFVLAIIVFLLLLPWYRGRRKVKLEDAENVPLIGELKNKIAKLEEQLKDTNDQLMLAQKQAGKYSGEKSELERELKYTRDQLVATKADVEAKDIENRRQEKELGVLREDAKSKDILCKQLDGKLLSVEESKQRIQSEMEIKITELENKIAELEAKSTAPEIINPPKVFKLKPCAQNEKIELTIKSITELDVKLMHEERKLGKVEKIEVKVQGLYTNLIRNGNLYTWTLNIKELKEKYIHKYYLVASNQHGTDTAEFVIAIAEGGINSAARHDSTTVSIGDTTRVSPPRIVRQTGLRITQPLTDCIVCSREPLQLSVKAEGKKPLSATWFKNDLPVKLPYVKLSSGADGEFTLKINYTTTMDAGKYKCMIVDGNDDDETTEARVDFKMTSGSTPSPRRY